MLAVFIQDEAGRQGNRHSYPVKIVIQWQGLFIMRSLRIVLCLCKAILQFVKQGLPCQHSIRVDFVTARRERRPCCNVYTDRRKVYRSVRAIITISPIDQRLGPVVIGLRPQIQCLDCSLHDVPVHNGDCGKGISCNRRINGVSAFFTDGHIQTVCIAVIIEVVGIQATAISCLDANIIKCNLNLLLRLDLGCGIGRKVEADVISGNMIGKNIAALNHHRHGSLRIFSAIAVGHQKVRDYFKRVGRHHAHLHTRGQSTLGDVGRDDHTTGHGLGELSCRHLWLGRFFRYGFFFDHRFLNGKLAHQVGDDEGREGIAVECHRSGFGIEVGVDLFNDATVEMEHTRICHRSDGLIRHRDLDGGLAVRIDRVGSAGEADVCRHEGGQLQFLALGRAAVDIVQDGGCRGFLTEVAEVQHGIFGDDTLGDDGNSMDTVEVRLALTGLNSLGEAELLKDGFLNRFGRGVRGCGGAVRRDSRTVGNRGCIIAGVTGDLFRLNFFRNNDRLFLDFNLFHEGDVGASRDDQDQECIRAQLVPGLSLVLVLEVGRTDEIHGSDVIVQQSENETVIV